MFFSQFFDLVIADGSAGRFDQPGIDGDAFVDGQSLSFELSEDFGVDLIHGVFAKTASEPGKGGMIRGRSIKGKSQETLKGKPVVDLVFQFGVGLDPEPFLKEHAFIQQQRRIGVSAFAAGAHGVMTQQDGFDAGPMDGFIDFFQGFEASVVCQGFFHGQIGKGKRLVEFFESHGNPPVWFLSKSYHRKL